MTDTTRASMMTGGCQCGAVRYELYSEPTEPSICHCRMCQKAFGNYIAPLAGVPPKDLASGFAVSPECSGVLKR